MPINNKNPWWLDPSPDDLPYDGDAYSVDESMYIEADDDISNTNVLPPCPSPKRTLTTRDPNPTRSHHSDCVPKIPSPRSFQHVENATSSSPHRKSLQEISSSVATKFSNGTAKLSKNVSEKWNSVRASPDRPNNQSSTALSLENAGAARIDSSTSKVTAISKETSSRKSNGIAQSLGNSLSVIGRKAVALGTGSHQQTPSVSTDNVQPESSRSGRSTSVSSNGSASSFRRYTVKELVQCLGRNDVDLPPALERRVRDFKFAQTKRRDRHGENKPWGIFGLYAHLSDIRADLEWAEDAAWRRQRSEPYLSWTDFEKSRDKGLRNRPWFTYGVIAVCSLMLFVSFGVNGWKVEPLNVNPLIGPSSETLIKVGARQTDLIVNEGQWFRLFTPLVLHAGLVHYVINMCAMYFIGGAVEQSHGFASAAVLFILPAVGGNILSAICLPQYISVGASGGIFGLIGGCLADISINWDLLFLKSTTDDQSRWRHFMVLFWLAFDMIINCVIGLTPFVDNFTHLGGFLYGLCCGLSTIERLAVGFFGLKSNNYSKAWSTFLRFFGLIASVISIMVTTVVLVQSDGVTSPCHGCRYISCVPFPPRAEDKWWYCDDCDFVTADLFINGAGTGLYEEIELECPNGEIERIDISADAIYDKDDVRKALPTYCRSYCEEVFTTH